MPPWVLFRVVQYGTLSKSNRDLNVYSFLQHVRENSFSGAEGGGNPDKQKIVILMTDGKSNAGAPPQHEAHKLKAEGVTVIAIGIGQGFVKTELEQIATMKNYVLTTNSFSELSTLLKLVIDLACEGE